MATTANDLLNVTYAGYKLAFTHRAADLKDAKTADDVQRIMANVDDLEAKYLDAARLSFDATGPGIEAAYKTALAATQAVESAYAQGKALADRIRAVAGAVTALGTLLTKAAGTVA